MKRAPVKVTILNYFTRQDLFIHQAKFHLLLRPPSTLWDIFQIFYAPKPQKITLTYSAVGPDFQKKTDSPQKYLTN